MAGSIPLIRIDDVRWEIPVSFRKGMRVPGRIFCDEKNLPKIHTDQSLEQVVNVAFLPGIVNYAMAMPDIHWGYGFPIGGVAAMDPDEGGVVSPGGVGYDINCGVRMLRTNLTEPDIRPRIKELVGALFSRIPCGVGESGDIKLNRKEIRQVAREGSSWVIKQGFGEAHDLDHTEAGGCLEGADPQTVSERAYERGNDQLGTLGSGNHFLEVQVVDRIFEPETAACFGVAEGQITIMIHSGSRGFGYQICEDSLGMTRRALSKYGIHVPDIQLSCAPVHSSEGKQYLAAMRCAANFAWANRQCLTHLVREVFGAFLGKSPKDLGMDLVYDVSHNIAKFERFAVNGKEKMLCVHRKGATRAYAPGCEELPEAYRTTGQPVIIPGDMGRNSYLLAGTQQAMDETFGSCCHGAGRAMSRTAALKAARGHSVRKELEERGIFVMARGERGIAEEQPAAYKDVNEVVDIVSRAGLARKVARMRPLGVIKG
ncbi:MAG: RNA-splicing ligase RtcB [Candidatus Omnitrophica bacterium ADurb.Bin277]|nr:MAG: RNA-splicing ligase RtcB [Candidatus Omnitrophica bacterium ADurb.Bin277]